MLLERWRVHHFNLRYIHSGEGCIQSFLNVKLEVEYLTEMVRLATK